MHLPTLIVITLLTNLLIGFYLSILYRRRPKDKCFKYWALSCGCFVFGISASVSRGYDVPAFFSFFIADFFLIITAVLVLLGLIRFSRFRFTKAKRQRSIAILCLMTLALFFSYHNPALVTLVGSLSVAMLFIAGAWLIRRSVFNEPIYTGTLQFIFILHSVVLIVQAALVCFHWDNINYSGLPDQAIHTLLSHVTLTTLTALLLPWLSFLKLERSLTIKSQRDGLTKLANRTFFFSQVERHWLQYPQVKVVLMMIDIDHFKEINDKFGHHVGDIALKAVADIMSKGLRSHDLIGRIGGEEFAVILYNIELDVAQQIANRLCNQVMKQMAVIDGHNINLTISIGMVQVLPARNQIHGAFKVADEALYHSKHSGRNTVTLGQLNEVSS